MLKAATDEFDDPAGQGCACILALLTTTIVPISKKRTNGNTMASENSGTGWDVGTLQLTG